MTSSAVAIEEFQANFRKGLAAMNSIGELLLAELNDLGAQSSSASPDPSGERVTTTIVDRVSAGGVTFVFAEPAEVGVYAVGDRQPFVRGSVDIVELQRNAFGTNTSGAMLNPARGDRQGYDDRMVHLIYVDGNNVAKQLPLTIDAGNSLVATVSRAGVARPQCESLAILTVVDEVPLNDEFRPGYAEPAGQKSRHRMPSTLRITPFTLSNPQQTMPTVASVLAPFNEPRLDHYGNWANRYLASWSGNGLPDYGRELARAIGNAAARMIDSRTLDADRRAIAERLIQFGLDTRAVAVNGGATNWEANGGHNQGRAFPMRFACAMLDLSVPTASMQEDQQYYWRDDDTPEWRFKPGQETTWGETDGSGDLLQHEKYRECCTTMAHWGMQAAMRQCTHANGKSIAEEWGNTAYEAFQHRYRATAETLTWDPYPMEVWRQVVNYEAGQWPTRPSEEG